MKRWILLLILSVFSAFTGFVNVYAQNEEVKKNEEVSSDADDKKNHEHGEAKKVEERLEKEFNVSDARVDSLRQQGLGYGEIRHVFSLAKQMPGGINDQNVKKIMDLRQGDGKHKEGWGKIARDLGLKLRPGKQDHISETRREEKSEEKMEKKERLERTGEGREHSLNNHESREDEMSLQSSSSFHRGGGHRR